jgi:hypothetical protein
MRRWRDAILWCSLLHNTGIILGILTAASYALGALDLNQIER